MIPALVMAYKSRNALTMSAMQQKCKYIMLSAYFFPNNASPSIFKYLMHF